VSELSRIGVAIDAELLAEFDELIGKKGYANRSEAFRDLIRERLIGEEASHPKATGVGTLTLVYDHHVRSLNDKLTRMGHDHHKEILSTLHIHLDHDNCLEVIVLKGKVGSIRKIAERLIATKGVKHGKLTLTSG